jgi:hypothetical protein
VKSCSKSKSDEFLAGQKSFNWGRDTIEQLALNTVKAALQPAEAQAAMYQEFRKSFEW